MNKPFRALIRTTLIAAAAVLAQPAASYAQVKVILSGGFTVAYKELVPAFEKSTGITVTTTSGASVGSGPNTIPNQIRRGVQADIVILSREGLVDLIKEGKTVAGTDTDLARSVIGVIVRAGAPKPDISTVEALRQTLLRAKSVAMSSSTSGVYLSTKLFPQLGIADEMKPKSSFAGAAAVGRGEAELGLQQVSEVLPVPGVDYIGTIPKEVQYTTTYAAAVVAGSHQVDAAKKLIAFLSSPGADAAITKSGMEPARRR
jgi:molybdate transport system substrate-binding protein